MQEPYLHYYSSSLTYDHPGCHVTVIKKDYILWGISEKKKPSLGDHAYPDVFRPIKGAPDLENVKHIRISVIMRSYGSTERIYHKYESRVHFGRITRSLEIWDRGYAAVTLAPWMGKTELHLH